VVAQFTFSVVCPVEVPGEVTPIVIDVLLLVEFVFWITMGAERLAVEVPLNCVPPTTAGNLTAAAPVAALASNIPAVAAVRVVAEAVQSVTQPNAPALSY
jgi:hypothetical protein